MCPIVAEPIQSGLFIVLLGSSNPIQDSIFADMNRWVGISLQSLAEMSPRVHLSSVPYSFRVSTVDGASGGAIAGSLSAEVHEASAQTTAGLSVSMDNVSTGITYGGLFSVSDSGTGSRFGVAGSSSQKSSAGATGVLGQGVSSGDGPARGGIFDARNFASGDSYGIEVFGYSISGLAFGVYGGSLNSGGYTSYGAYCYANNTSSEGGACGGHFEALSVGDGFHTGVEGYGNSLSDSSPAFGVRGFGSNSSSGNSYGGYFLSTSEGAGQKYGLYAQAPASTGNYAGYFSGNVKITDSLIVLGGMSGAIRVGSGEYRLVYSHETTEAWLEDFGRSQLLNGKVHVELDPLFLQTVTISVKYPMEVYVQLRDDCNGTYVTSSATGFDVVELQGGKSNAPFSYRVVAKRKGLEDMRLAKMGGPMPEEVQAEQIKQQEEFRRAQIRLDQERGKLEMERARMQSLDTNRKN